MDAFRAIDNVNVNTILPKISLDTINLNNNEKIKTESSEGGSEFCLNTTGIIVTIAMFVVIQVIISYMTARHLFQKARPFFF